MADITITIPAPVLTSGQFFKVEYSTDGVNYTVFSTTETNAPFTITGLSTGTKYWFRYSLLQGSPLTACNPIVQTRFIPEVQPCVEVEGEIEVNGDIYNLILTFTLPSPYSDPCGGYRLEYGVSPNFNSITFPTFLASPSINPMTLPATNAVYTVRIYSIDCEGNEVLCDEITVNPPSGCTHAVILDSHLDKSGANYFLRFSIQQSNPVTTSYLLTYSQANAVTSGVADPGGTISIPTNGSPIEAFVVQVYPNVNVPNNVISYVGVVVDRCNYASKFDESVILT